MIPKNKPEKPYWLRLLPIALLAVGVTVLGFFPLFVENAYSQTLYPAISVLLRLCTRWMPFSLGDLIYIVFSLRVLIGLARFFVELYRKKLRPGWFARSVYRSLHFLLWAYIVFKCLWGLNYDRLGVAHQLAIKKMAYNKGDLVNLTNRLIDKVNEARRQLPDTVLPRPELDALFRDAFRAYQLASLEYEFLNYRNRSVKKSLFTRLGDYMGFSGYYNPFTGEAQVRADIPRILIPYIVCHEMAHQLGYASESEANFVGYLAAARSENAYFRYSVYLDLFSYAQAEELALLAKEKDRTEFDSTIKWNRQRLDTLVKKDRREIRAFFDKRRNRVSPAVSGLYDQYLKMNKQFEGIRSYDEVIGLLLAYQRKYGKL
ncbi:DUF3810 domain-containing protein [Sediminibacterium soli]|uniref:DUF3810 domain-containing protein n=1 Tax=Sediminibacterium soli TaxID=2698829 RepID=UPI00137A9E0D|nr:DUF3810 domain-containing protein [Sediminibacterium soli]NCI47028.1 DUF3810 domain-containing protein [Sediminibacterium soli]